MLGFAASSFAIHAEIPAETQAVIAKGSTQVTIGGLLRTRAWYFNNLDRRSGSGSTHIPNDDGSRGFYDQRVQLLVDAQITPNVKGLFQLQGDQVWGSAGANQKGDSLAWIQAWIQYTGSGLFGFPAGLKIGHMPLALGNQTFFQHTTNGSDAIVFFMDPTKALHVGLLTVKLNERTTRTDNADDTDAYVALTTYKINDKNTVGANYTYINKSSNPEVPGSDTVTDMKLQNLGIHANGSAAGFGYKASADIQFGKMSDGVKARGYGIVLAGNYKVNPVNVRASFAYGSGDKASTTDKNEGFQTFLSDVEHYTIAYEYRVISAAGGINTGINNTTYYNLGVDFSPTKDITASLDGYVLRASKTASGISKTLGWEVDAKLVYKVARNLNYVVDAGYFKTGSYYGDRYGSTAEENVTLVRQQLILSF